tara:strand:- start:1172 stop:5074 length:3903 start_codon:yes stop_codon:yes gene_type:complete
MTFKTFEEKEEQFKAEMALYMPEAEETGFKGGFVGGHESIGSWFTSGLTGLLASKGTSDNAQRKWYIQRNGIQFGYNKLEEAIASYKDIKKYRTLNRTEREELQEMERRYKLITRDIKYVYDNKKGDLDASIDKDGKSFNERWGVDNGEEGALAALAALFSEHPAYVGGVFTAEILKDLPIAVLAYLATPFTGGTSGAAQTAKYGFNITKALNKLNNIQPKVLRGLAKMGTGVTAGALVGAGYEAAYTKLEQGDVKGDQVKAGAAFGSAFGILSGLGILSRTSKDMKIKKAEKASVASAVSGPTYKEMVQGAKKEPKVADVDEVVDSLYPAEEIKDAKKAAHKIYTEHNERLFPELQNGREYKILTLAQAKAAKIADIKDDLAVQMRVQDGVSNIIWQEGKITPLFKKFYKNYEDNLGKYFNEITPRMHLFMRDENSFRAYLMANQLAQVKQRLMPEVKDTKLKQQEANSIAMTELERAWDEVNLEKQNKSDVEVEATLESIRARVKVPEMGDIPTSKPTSTSKIGDFLEKNPKTAAAAVVGAGVAAYTMTNKEKKDGKTIGDPIRNTAAAMLAVGLGPKAYRLLKGETLNQITFKIKAEVAKNLEISDRLIRAYEERAQHISDRLDALPIGEADWIINDIETKKNSFPKDSPQRKLKEDIEAILDEYSKLASEKDIDLIGKNSKLDLTLPKGPDGQPSAPFISNYFPHLFVNMDKLTDADLAKIFGKINDKSARFRNIDVTLIELQRMIDDGELPTHLTLVKPAQAINLYIQGMGRAIIGRRAIKAMRDLDLNLNTAKGEPKLTPAMLTTKEFDVLKASGHFNDQEALHYRTFRHPSLDGFVAHNNVHHILDDFFKVSNRGGWGEMAERLLKMNNALKRVFVFGSLFHAQALIMSSVYALGGLGAIKGLTGRGTVTKGFGEGNRAISWQELKLGTGEFVDLADEWLKNSSLRIGNIRKQELSVPGFGSEKVLTERMGKVGAAMQKAFDGVDWFTWDYLHDRFKLAVAMKHKEKLMYDRKGRRTQVSEKEAYELAADFANDSFGTLDFNKFTSQLYDYAAKNPDRLRSKAAALAARALPVDKRRWLNLALFAPDWTISNIRIVGKMITGIPKMSKALAKRVHEGKWTDPKAQEIVRAWNMYAAYSTRAGIYTSAMWWLLTEMFSSEEANMENLWEFWSGDNSGKLDLGGGESMVISKQIAEPIHWLQHPMHTFMNKSSVVPKTALEAMFNKQWFSLKQGMPLGPRLVEEDGTTHYAKWLLGKGVPIVTKPLFDEDLDWIERIERVLTGFVGLPQYGNPEK